MKFKHLLFTPLAAIIFLASCSKELAAPAVQPTLNNEKVLINHTTSVSKVLTVTQTFAETFESGTKTAYASGSVSLGSGSWTLNDALIGNSSADLKSGSQSVRVRNTGTLTMNFNVSTGASTVTVKYGIYGTDGPSNFQLWVSANSGST
ncbi:MAG TPA: DNA/RNA non-specific endonuclease, partial [Pedobacter sp.]